MNEPEIMDPTNPISGEWNEENERIHDQVRDLAHWIEGDSKRPGPRPNKEIANAIFEREGRPFATPHGLTGIRDDGFYTRE